MALKMMLIALFTTLVAVSGFSLRVEEPQLDGFAQQDMEEEDNVMSEIEYHLPEEDPESFQQMEEQDGMSEYNEYPTEMEDETNGEVISDLLATTNAKRAERLRVCLFLLSGGGNQNYAGPRKHAVTQGSTVALQQGHSYLGCSGKNCIRTYGPGPYMEGSDWTKYQAVVFRIYRKNGAGPICVGDSVGLYYPAGSNWFAMSGNKGHREACPGTPTIKNGFQDQGKWHACWGEVFQIYARGKSNGDVVYENDHIILYYPKENKYVGLIGNHVADVRTCPGPVRPPPASKYEPCGGEVFEIWKQ